MSDLYTCSVDDHGSDDWSSRVDSAAGLLSVITLTTAAIDSLRLPASGIELGTSPFSDDTDLCRGTTRSRRILQRARTAPRPGSMASELFLAQEGARMVARMACFQRGRTGRIPCAELTRRSLNCT